MSGVVRGPTRPTPRELEALRAALAPQATGAHVSIRRDQAIAILNELLELRELTETTGRALRQLGGIARDADARDPSVFEADRLTGKSDETAELAEHAV